MRSRSRSPKLRRGPVNNSTNYKVRLIKTPSLKNPKYYLILGKSRDGRYVARAAKPGVKVKDLSKRRSRDFGRPMTLRKGSRVVGSGKKSRRVKK